MWGRGELGTEPEAGRACRSLAGAQDREDCDWPAVRSRGASNGDRVEAWQPVSPPSALHSGAAPPPDEKGSAGSLANGSARPQPGGGVWGAYARAPGRPLGASRGRTRVGVCGSRPSRPAQPQLVSGRAREGGVAVLVPCRGLRVRPGGTKEKRRIGAPSQSKRGPLETCCGTSALARGPT